MAEILIIEDDISIRQMIKFSLESDSYICTEIDNIDEAEKILFNKKIDIILLDWMLPGLSGIEFVKRIKRRKQTKRIPIIMLTAKSTEEDKLKGFAVGVDDYLTKPFSVKELSARITAVLRRGHIASGEPDKIPIRIDSERKRAFVSENEIKLTTTEFQLLDLFLSRKERVFTRTELIDLIWESEREIDQRTIDVHIRRLRKVLMPFSCDIYIQTVRGFGYRFSMQTEKMS